MGKKNKFKKQEAESPAPQQAQTEQRATGGSHPNAPSTSTSAAQTSHAEQQRPQGQPRPQGSQQREGNQQRPGNEQHEGSQQRQGYQQREGYQQRPGNQQHEGHQQRQGYQQREGYQQRPGNQQHEGSQQRQGYQQREGYQQRPGNQQHEGSQQRQGYQQREGYQQRPGNQQHEGHQQRQGYQQREGYQQRPGNQQHEGSQQRQGYQQREGHQRPQAVVPLVPHTGHIARGTLGRPGSVGINYLTVDMSKMPAKAYHYDVTITPERPKKFYRKAFEIFCAQHLNNLQAAYDGRKSCYSVEKLPCTTGDVEVVDIYSRTIHYKIVLKETDNPIVELSSLHSYMKDKIYDKPMRALQCLETVLAAPCHQRSIRSGRSFFKASEDSDRQELGDGYEALVGLYQSFVLGDIPFVNVDVSHKSFPIAMPIIEYLTRFAGIPELNAKSKLGNYTYRVYPFLKGINVVYEPPKCFGSSPRSFKVNGFSQNSANAQEFEIDGKSMTVQAYFSSRKYTLKYPNLECLHVGPPAKNIYLPIELCRIEEGQALNRKDGATQVSEMIKFAATTTDKRKEKILDLLKYFQHNLHPTIKRFGISIGSDFIEVVTRCLQAPELEYYNKRFSKPMNGSWRMDSQKFLVVKTKSHKWAVLFPEVGPMLPGKVQEFENMVLSNAKSLSMVMEPVAEIRKFRNDRDLNLHLEELKKMQYDLVFVIIPNRGTTYDYIKQKAELKHGILTQCIKQNNVNRRLNPQLVSNILLKVNSKLNGINHKLKDDTRTAVSNVMFLGADVTHPSPDQREIPSVVGVAASHDKFGGSYNMQYRLQRAGSGGAREEIDDMESIVSEHLRVYKIHQNRYPDHIIYYRDGVSDGQFMKIKNIELMGISAACAKLKIQPKMCCIIVVKRHHTRFFPRGVPNPRNKFNNVEPGTVVDRTIVHPNEVQFFMVSHQSIQGTAKPTRYNVIENTGKLDIDLLQQLTYNLCHMFPRCNRSVSYPAPAYLAHLAAARGRVYISDCDRRDCRSPQEEYQRHLINAAFMISNPMYFV